MCSLFGTTSANLLVQLNCLRTRVVQHGGTSNYYTDIMGRHLVRRGINYIVNEMVADQVLSLVVRNYGPTNAIVLSE